MSSSDPSSSAGVAPPANDGCANATLLDLSTGTTTVDATLAGAANDTNDWCESGHPWLDGPDAFYTFILSEARVVTVTLAAGVPSAEMALVLMHGACGSLSLSSCSTDTQHSGNASLNSSLLGAGNYVLIVDSRSFAAAGYTLTVTSVAVPAGETCSTAVPLDSSYKGVTIARDLSGHSNDLSFGCESGMDGLWGPDLVYALYLSEPRVLSFSLGTTATASELGLFMLSGTCGSLSMWRCRTDWNNLGAAALEPAIYAAGTHYFAVDSRYPSASPMPFTVTIDSASIPDGATCSRAVPLSLSTGTATATGDLALHTDDTSPGCESAMNALYGPDIFFTFTLTATATVTASFTTTATASELGLMLWSGACGSTTQRACGTDWQRDGATSISLALGTGTYLLAVDSRYRAASMPFSLQVDAVP